MKDYIYCYDCGVIVGEMDEVAINQNGKPAVLCLKCTAEIIDLDKQLLTMQLNDLKLE